MVIITENCEERRHWRDTRVVYPGNTLSFGEDVDRKRRQTVSKGKK